MGVNANWKLVNSLTPVVPLYKRLVKHVEDSFGLQHSTKHTIPKADLEVLGIMRMLAQGGACKYQANRADLAESNPPKDVIALGASSLQDTSYIADLFADRWSYIAKMSNLEDYSFPTNATPVERRENQPLDALEEEQGATPLEEFEDPRPFRLYDDSLEDELEELNVNVLID